MGQIRGRSFASGPLPHAFLIALLAAPFHGARADDAPDLLNDTFSGQLGSYVLNTNTELRLDGDLPNSGTKVDWEKNFGEGDVTRFRLDGAWRFAERHKIRGMWFDFS